MEQERRFLIVVEQNCTANLRKAAETDPVAKAIVGAEVAQDLSAEEVEEMIRRAGEEETIAHNVLLAEFDVDG